MRSCSPNRLGEIAEEMAHLFLAVQGFDCLARRYRKAEGELDLVVRRGPLMVFVEVKARRSSRCGIPEAGVTRQKLQRMRRGAGRFLHENGTVGVREYRFDVVAIDFAPDGSGCCLRHHRGAF